MLAYWPSDYVNVRIVRFLICLPGIRRGDSWKKSTEEVTSQRSLMGNWVITIEMIVRRKTILWFVPLRTENWSKHLIPVQIFCPLALWWVVKRFCQTGPYTYWWLIFIHDPLDKKVYKWLVTVMKFFYLNMLGHCTLVA